MTSQPFLAVLIPALLSILFALVKVGFLIWVFIRTQQVPAVCYAVYVLLAGLGRFIVPALLAQMIVRDAAASLPGLLSAYSTFSALVETVLFIGLVRSLLRIPCPDPLS